VRYRGRRRGRGRFFFGEDAVEGEALMAFALVCGAWRGQPDGYLVDGGFDQLTGARLHWCRRPPYPRIEERHERGDERRVVQQRIDASQLLGQPLQLFG
jgi:hypothetical protein